MRDDLTEQIKQEELKRLRMTDPARWWQQMQELCTLAEAQTVPRRNSKEGCLLDQQKKQANWEAYQARQRSSSDTKE